MLPGENHGNPVPWTPREGKTNWEILQRGICHSICSKTCWKPQRASWKEACPWGNRDCLAERPEQWGWHMRKVKGRRASQHAFHSPEAAGSLRCSQMTRGTAATRDLPLRKLLGYRHSRQERLLRDTSILCKQHSVPCPGSCLCLQPGLKPF